LDKEFNFGSNLKILMDERKLNSVSMGKLVDRTSATVRHWCNSAAQPRLNELTTITHALEVTILDLFPNEKHNAVSTELKNNLDNYEHLIPSINIPSSLKQIELTKGYPTLSVNKTVTEQSMQNVNHIYIDKRMIEKTYQEEQLKAVVMVGDSMQPYLQHGDVAIYYPTPKFIAPGKYVLQTPHGLELKSVSFLRNGKMQLKSENESYPTELVETQDIDTVEILGLVVGRIVKG